MIRLTGFFLLAALLLACIAHQRPPEYDEAYSIFLTAGDARPAWPAHVFAPGSVRDLYAPNASLSEIAQNLKSGDVHPPLYFWALKFWRQIFGPSWLAARLLSVALSLGSLSIIAWLARATHTPVLPALAITLLSYGFAYTGIVARGFSLAQFLNLAGTAYIISASRNGAKNTTGAGGLALGAASFANYLAAFTGLAILLHLTLTRDAKFLRRPAALGFLIFIPLDWIFFSAQRHSRSAQFAAFSPLHATALLTKDFGAALFGGLPLYAGRFGPIVAVLLLVFTLICLQKITQSRPNPMFCAAAVAPPCGLFALGLIFHNTPIEIRYLAFSLPYVALLLAAALPKKFLAPLLILQTAAIIGLAFAPATMQPQALAARQAMGLKIPGALILLPFGNDGVGIPGPFIATLPDNARVKLLHTNTMPDLREEQKIILATISIDAASRTSTAQALAYFQAQKNCFCRGPVTSLTQVYLNRCTDQQP
jgi:hypothetical protein